MRVGFDLDGVLYDFGASVRRYLSSVGLEYGFKDDADEPHTWNFFEYWHMTPKEFVEMCNAGADAGFIFCGGVRPNAVETVWAVKNLGHEIIVITDRQFGSTPSVSHEHTKNWWRENGFPDYDELHFSADKTVAPTDIFVEDKLENCDALMEAGTTCWLINRPWNQVEDIRADTFRYRMNDVSEYTEKVELEDFILNDLKYDTRKNVLK